MAATLDTTGPGTVTLEGKVEKVEGVEEIVLAMGSEEPGAQD